MNGSGGSFYVPPRSADQILEESHEEIDKANYISDVNETLENVLRDSNDRDTDQDRSRVDEIAAAINLDGTVVLKMRFGGSVSRHTYVDGLSDVDILATLSDQYAAMTPREVLGVLERRLRDALPGTIVSTGSMAVTVCYPDGQEYQILPAITTANGVKLPSSVEGGWSRVIRPSAFANKLTETNRDHAGRVVPVVKLFKAIVQSTIPNDMKLRGYHAESMAIEAFKGYDGPLSYKELVTHMFKSATTLVLEPIRDRTGQSVHVDDYLGEANSDARHRLSKVFQRISSQIDRADSARDLGVWSDLVDADS